VTFFRPIRVRLTLWYVLLVAAILAAFSAVLYLSLRQVLYENLNDSLDNRADIVLALLTYEDGRPGLSGVDFPGDPVEGEHFTRVFDSSGQVTFDNSVPESSAPIGEDAVAAALNGTSSRRSAETDGDRLRILTAPIVRDSEVVGAVQVGLTEDDAREALRILLVIIAIAYPLTLAATSAGGVFLAGRALSPIDRLTRVARQITAEGLSQRLDLALPDDEVGRLARTFDEMIARLDQSFARQRQFTADASHELRTPLTAIKGQAEVALQRDRATADYKEALAAINGEVDRMIRLVTSLLTLARADAGQIPIAREPVSLAAVVGAAVEQVAPGAAEKTISLRVGSGQDVQLVADQDLLLQLTLNLLDNAVKYTPAGGSVEVRWTASGEDAEIRVTDTGPGIPPEDLPRIFDRFYRVDQARSRAEGGAGVGLSISRWIAEAHGGSISAESTSGGATFIVRIPLGR
jgi:heavy metal sensor kinase